MKKLLRLMAVILVASGVWMGACDALSQEITYSGPPITLRFSTHSPTTHPLFKTNWYPWIEMVKNESKGKLLFQVYAAESLHGARDGFHKSTPCAGS